MSALDALMGLRPMCEMVHRGYPHPGCAEFGPPDEWACGRPASWFSCSPGEDPGAMFCTGCVLDQGMLAAPIPPRLLSADDLVAWVTGLFDGAWADISPNTMIGLLYGADEGIAPPEPGVYRCGWYDGVALLCGPTWEAYYKEDE